jgi:hypothetical protein
MLLSPAGALPVADPHRLANMLSAPLAAAQRARGSSPICWPSTGTETAPANKKPPEAGVYCGYFRHYSMG